MLISSMAFINSVVFSMEVPILSDTCVPVDVPVTRRVVVGGSVGAKATTNVEGTVLETVEITV